MTGVPRVAPAPPPADLPVDLRRIELLCARLRPEDGVELERVDWAIGKLPRAEGWDNALWPVGRLGGHQLVLRVARREASRALLAREVTVLRRLRGLGTQLPMKVPTVLATQDDAVLVPWIDGVTAAEAGPEVRLGTAQALARMLATLHSGPGPEVGHNPVRGVPLSTRAAAFDADLDRAALDPDLKHRAETRWRTGLAAALWDGRELLLHGDPHPGNVVVPAPGAHGGATLIDWGDTTRGDPASDLGGLLLHAPSAQLLTAYREAAAWTGIDEEAVWEALEARAWAWATRLALLLITAYPPEHELGSAGHRLLTS
ncbi:phosphotransferase [Brachybacterium vulturis]|uniref:phosphotransferase n=1 Tax=Brachybacterium vulturis TaxID=2017484 RepID=UPI0037366C53